MNFKALFSKTNIIIFGVIVVLPMLYIAYDFVKTQYFGSAIGEACTTASDCKGSGAWCLDKADGKGMYCSKQCFGDVNCPTSWSCGGSGYTRQVRYSSGATGAKTKVNVCWKDQKVPMSR